MNMNLQKDDTTIKQEQEQYIKDKVYPWKLENQTRTSKTESQSTLIAKYMNT